MKTYFLVASVAATVVARGGAEEYDWWQQDRIRRELQNQTWQAEQSNRLLRESNQQQRYQAYLQEVAYHQQNHPDEPPPKPQLSPDPMDYPHNVFIMKQWVNMVAQWEEKKNRREAEAAAQTSPSEEDLEAAFQQQVVESRAKRDRVYPEALEPNHPIHEEAEKIWKNIEETDHALLSDPDAPFKVYEMAALRLGIKPTGQP